MWEAFEVSGFKNISLYQSAIFRFTIPGLGGRKPSGARLNSKEIAAALKILSSISIAPDTAGYLREAQKQTFALLNISKHRQRQPRYYLNQFINWGIANDFFPFVKSSEEKQDYIFYPQKINYIKTTNRKKICKFAFSFNVDDYVTESLSPEQIQQHLQRISQEFNDFKKYEVTTQGIRLASAKNHENLLKQFLGWLYKTGQFSLAETSLSKIVPYIKLNFKISEFSSEENPWLSQIIAKAKALENITDEANCLVNLIKEFFEWLENTPSPCTQKFYVGALIAYSKYVYRAATNKAMALNFEDIPLINRLKVLQKEVESINKDNSNSSSKYLPWGDVLKVLENLRFEADLETRKDKGNYKRKRSLPAKAKSLQKFLLLGFFVLVPPSRQRVIRELELSRTLKYGIFENGRFTSFEKVANPNEAKYYIHLQPEDYKTGDIYKEWLGEFPNTEFSEGSKFYDYLNRWLFRGYQDENGKWHGMRELIAASGEKTVFVKEEKGLSFSNESGIAAKIKRFFVRWTGVPITPHDLRHLYRTYIDDPATGATPEEKESAAYWMRHSSKTAAKTYSHLDNEKKLRAGTQLSSRINQMLLGSS
jgi:hypothetical protein